MPACVNTIQFQEVGLQDIHQVGGKNASLGEMIQNLSAADILVPAGFATTADAFRVFLAQQDMDKKIYQALEQLDVEDVQELAKVGKMIRQWIVATPFVSEFETDVRTAYATLEKNIGHKNFSVAVRSSATAEDLPDASFAGQQETFLNVTGLEAIFKAIKEVFASLFNDRAIAYRVHQGFDHRGIALSAGIQQMVRSDLAASGVMFTVDTESGFDQVVLITSAYGLGEMVVQGAVNPDEFYVYKPALKAGNVALIRRNLGSKALKMIYCQQDAVKTEKVPVEQQRQFSLTTPEVEALAHQAVMIETHYGLSLIHI